MRVSFVQTCYSETTHCQLGSWNALADQSLPENLPSLRVALASGVTQRDFITAHVEKLASHMDYRLGRGWPSIRISHDTRNIAAHAVSSGQRLVDDGW